MKNTSELGSYVTEKDTTRTKKFIHMHICFRTKLSNATATSYIWLLKFKLLKIKSDLKSGFSVALPIFQVLNSHMWLLATIFNGAGIEHFYYCRKLSRIMLL